MNKAVFDALRKSVKATIKATGNHMDLDSIDSLLETFDNHPNKRITMKKKFSTRKTSTEELRDLAKSQAKNKSKTQLIKDISKTLTLAVEQINKTTDRVNSLIKSNNDLVLSQKKMEAEIILLKGEKIPTYGEIRKNEEPSNTPDSQDIKVNTPIKKSGRSVRSV